MYFYKEGKLGTNNHLLWPVGSEKKPILTHPTYHTNEHLARWCLASLKYGHTKIIFTLERMILGLPLLYDLCNISHLGKPKPDII